METLKYHKRNSVNIKVKVKRYQIRIINEVKVGGKKEGKILVIFPKEKRNSGNIRSIKPVMSQDKLVIQ